MDNINIFSIVDVFKSFPLAAPYLEDFIDRVEADGGTVEKGALSSVTNYIRWLEWMALYDDIFLVMPPLAYKVGKLYALYPTDGSGDMVVTRASYATRMNAQGLLEEMINDVPRIDYSQDNPTILVENESTNLCKRSESLNSWVKELVTISSNEITSPDGNQTADKIVENTDNSHHRIWINLGIVNIGDVISFSLYIKGTERNIVIVISGASTSIRALFNPTNGTVIESGSFSNVETEDVGNGWYRCLAQITATSTSNLYLYVRLADGLNEIYQGDGSSGGYVWGVQVELQSVPTSYIPTAGATVTRLRDNNTTPIMSGTFDLLNDGVSLFSDIERIPNYDTYVLGIGINSAPSSFIQRIDKDVGKLDLRSNYEGNDGIVEQLNVASDPSFNDTIKALSTVSASNDKAKNIINNGAIVYDSTVLAPSDADSNIRLNNRISVLSYLLYEYYNLAIIYNKILADNAMSHISIPIRVPIATLHPDVEAWQTRVLADGGTIEDIASVQAQIQDLLDKGVYYDGFFIAVPDGYKAGKLYAINPVDGSGDMVVARASYATRMNSDGLLEQVVNNVPRIDYSEGEATILIEKKSTNLCTYSQFNSLWSGSRRTLTPNAITSPLGTLTGATFVPIDSSTHYIVTTTGVIPNLDMVCSLYVKKISDLTKLRITFTASDAIDYADIDIVTKAVTLNGIITSAVVEDFVNGWVKVTITGTYLSLTSQNLRIHALDNDGEPSFDADGVSGYGLFGYQFEEGSVPTSYIPTAGGTVTRLKDTSTTPTMGTATLFNNGITILNNLAKLTVSNVGVETSIAGMSVYNSDGHIYLYQNISTGQVRGIIRGGNVSIATFSGKAIVGYPSKIIVTYKGSAGEIKSTINGSTVLEQAIAIDSASIDRDFRFLGRSYSQGQSKHTLFAVFSRVLTNAEMQDLTS